MRIRSTILSAAHASGPFFVGAGVVGLAAALNWVLFGPGDTADVGMVFLLGVVVIALRFGFWPSLATAGLSGIAFAYFFAPPIFQLAISDLTHLVTFLVLLGIAVVVSELARRVRVQARESEQRRAEVERERMRNTLLSSVSHDLRTPLASIIGAASSLATQGDSLPPGTRGELVSSILREAERLNRHIRGLLDMTRLESGPVVLQRDWEAVEDLLGATLDRMGPMLSAHEVTTRVAADLPMVSMDAQLVAQVLTNLIENAVKYSDPGTRIEIDARATEADLVVEVADRGCGIPAEAAEQVFEKFVRLDGGRRREGSGLGLTVCRAILQLHGGTIRIAGREGGGTCVRFTLPLDGTPPGIPEDDAGGELES